MSGAEINLADIAERIGRAGHGEEIKVSDVVEALGSRSHFTIIFVIATAAATPLSGIPGVSMACGLMIALVAVERIAVRGDIYLPRFLKDRSLSKSEVTRVIEKLRPAIDFVDRHTHRRMGAVFKPPLSYLPLLMCVLSGLAMPFLEFLPFSSSIVATGVAFIAIAFVTRGGVIAILAGIPYLSITFLLLEVL